MRFSQYNLGLVFHTIYSCIFHFCYLFLLFPLLHFPPLQFCLYRIFYSRIFSRPSGITPRNNSNQFVKVGRGVAQRRHASRFFCRPNGGEVQSAWRLGYIPASPAPHAGGRASAALIACISDAVLTMSARRTDALEWRARRGQVTWTDEGGVEPL